MIKILKTILSVVSVLFVLGVLFWWGEYFFGGLTYLYHTKSVVIWIAVYVAAAVVTLGIFTMLIVMMFKGKDTARIICAALLVISIPISCAASFVSLIFAGFWGPYDCSYTENIDDYGVYDAEIPAPYFPEKITEEMTVVEYTYYYIFRDIPHTDLYLEVKFENKDVMEEYITSAKNSMTGSSFAECPNPYDSDYTDIILTSHVKFGGDEICRYTDMRHSAVTYSHDELTVIYNYTRVGSDLAVGDDPDMGDYYPKYLKRFNVEWNRREEPAANGAG